MFPTHDEMRDARYVRRIRHLAIALPFENRAASISVDERTPMLSDVTRFAVA
jgi:hypothetical protein